MEKKTTSRSSPCTFSRFLTNSPSPSVRSSASASRSSPASRSSVSISARCCALNVTTPIDGGRARPSAANRRRISATTASRLDRVGAQQPAGARPVEACRRPAPARPRGRRARRGPAVRRRGERGEPVVVVLGVARTRSATRPGCGSATTATAAAARPARTRRGSTPRPRPLGEVAAEPRPSAVVGAARLGEGRRRHLLAVADDDGRAGPAQRADRVGHPDLATPRRTRRGRTARPWRGRSGPPSRG